QLACGLESEIAGETEILGQIKQAWRDHEAGGSREALALRPWMQRLLQDTKEVRSEYVVGLGSATYGSLVRRLRGAEVPGPTLLLDAGQRAEPTLPSLDAGQVSVCTGSRERAEAMLAVPREVSTENRGRLLDTTPAAELAAWRQARDVIVCIPADTERDLQ